MLTEEQKQAYLKSVEEHERRMKTDPEYRARQARLDREFQKRGANLMGCIVEDKE